MQIACTTLHPVTLSAIVVNLLMIGAQLALYLQRPTYLKKLGFLILLVLLLFFNMANGLLPNGQYAVPIHQQYMILHVLGFVMASYFPFYFYRFLGFEKLRFSALYGVPLFLLLPCLILLVTAFFVHGDLLFVYKFGFIIPTVYAVFLLFSIGRAIRFSYRKNRKKRKYDEEVMAYIAIMPWAALAPITYFQLGQLTETLFANVGFLLLGFFLLYRSISRKRDENRELKELREMGVVHSHYFEESSSRYGLSEREKEVLHLIHQGLRNRAIADRLFIAENTVKKHIENMFLKTGVGGRMELVRLLFHRSDL